MVLLPINVITRKMFHASTECCGKTQLAYLLSAQLTAILDNNAVQCAVCNSGGVGGELKYIAIISNNSQ